MSSKTMNVALLQMHVEAGEPERNFERLAVMMEDAIRAEVKPDLLVFPEMWNSGYALDRIHEIADLNGARTKAFIASFCQTHHVNVIAGSIAEKQGDAVRNTAYAFNRDGDVVGDYTKLHLFRLMEEEKFLASGQKRGSLVLDGVNTGMMICYDIRFPELARKLALNGAELLVVPAEWPNPRLHHWRTLLTSRAIENQMFVLACNRVGISGTTSFFGHSMIIDPWGEVLAEGGEQEQIVTASINLDEVSRVRKMIPVFEDRRPEFY